MTPLSCNSQKRLILVPSRYLSVFCGERRLGSRLKRARGLMGREEGNPACALTYSPIFSHPKKHLNNDWVRVWKSLEHKENQTKYRRMNRKPRSHVRILIFRTWAIKTIQSLIKTAPTWQFWLNIFVLFVWFLTHRAKNGGNFSLVIPDEENPSGACNMFMLRNNNYNGCLPNKGIQFLIAKTLPPKFNLWREGIIDAYKRFFSEKIWTFCNLSIKRSLWGGGGGGKEGEASED